MCRCDAVDDYITCVCLYSFVNVYVCIRVFAYMYVCMVYVCLLVCKCLSLCVSMRIYIYIYVCVCVCVCVFSHILKQNQTLNYRLWTIISFFRGNFRNFFLKFRLLVSDDSLTFNWSQLNVWKKITIQNEIKKIFLNIYKKVNLTWGSFCLPDNFHLWKDFKNTKNLNKHYYYLYFGIVSRCSTSLLVYCHSLQAFWIFR